MEENTANVNPNIQNDEEAAAIMACITYMLGGKNYYVKRIRRLKDDRWVKHSRNEHINRNYVYNNFWR